jgi:putative transposase
MAVSPSGRAPRYDPDRHHRRSTRLKGYDYGQAGPYFVTICVQNRLCLFGDAVAGTMRLNDAGRMVQRVWDEIPHHYPGVDLDAFVVMPNHIHGIIVLVSTTSATIEAAAPAPDVGTVGAGPRARPDHPAPPRDRGDGQPRHRGDGQPRDHGDGQPRDHGDGQPRDRGDGQPRGVAPTGLSLPDVVHRFKTMTTRRYADGVKQHGWSPFPGRLWQRNYYEHIVRDDAALDRIRRYIIDNPQRWVEDTENPSRSGRAR